MYTLIGYHPVSGHIEHYFTLNEYAVAMQVAEAWNGRDWYPLLYDTDRKIFFNCSCPDSTQRGQQRQAA